jgi:DNA mismatch repair protein MutL
VRDTIRHKLTLGRPAAGFLQALTKHPSASPTLAAPEVPPRETPTSDGWLEANWPADEEPATTDVANTDFSLTPPQAVPMPGVLPFAAVENAMVYEMTKNGPANGNHRPSMGCIPAADWSPEEEGVEAGAGPSLHGLASLRPLGQLRESFILAVNQEGLWIIDQHVAHERILFERVLRQRRVAQVERQRLLMPMLIDLLPAQMVTFAGIAQELEGNGFEAEPFGPRTIAIKAAPAGLEGSALERMMVEVLEQAGSPEQAENLEAARTRIAASIACHAAIKVNTPLDSARMEWLLSELAKTEHPTSCPHGRPIVLRYAWKEIQRAFHRI